MAGYSPWMRSVTVGVTALQLSALLAAIEPQFPARLGTLNIQYSTGATASSHLYVGNSLVTAVNCGADLLVGGSVNIPITDAGLILSTDVWLLCTVAAQQVNIMASGIGA